MGTTHQSRPPDPAATWERFKTLRGEELQNWLDAEHAVAHARQSGSLFADPGDRLLAAEAALHGAIMDFAAAQDADSDPTPVALVLLRMVEDALETGERATPPPGGGRRHAPDRRRGRRTNA
jgi:hypothetical protein